MTLTIGRTSFVDGPFDIVHSGDRLAFQLDIIPDTLVEAKVMRQQMLGYLEDRGAVPVTWDDDADWDGFYTVESVQVAPVPSYLASGFMPATVTLKRVGGGYGSAVAEIVTVYDSRPTGVHSVTDAPIVWYPDDVLYASSLATPVSRTVDGGGLNGSEPGQVAPNDEAMALAILPASFYIGAATIEQQRSGTWYPVIGKQLPTGITTTDLRITNGFIRLSFVTLATSVVKLEVFDGTTWDEVGQFDFYDDGNTAVFPLKDALVITRNTPETVVVRVPYVRDAPGFNGNFIDMTLSRGDAFVGLTFSTSATWFDVQLGATSVTASTTITGGLRQTSNGAAGHRWVMGSDETITNDTTDGDMQVSTTPPGYSFFLGAELDGSSAATDDAATDVRDQWWAAQGLSQRIISP